MSDDPSFRTARARSRPHAAIGFVAFALACVLAGCTASAVRTSLVSDVSAIRNFREIEPLAAALDRTRTLLVLDIDDTLLTPPPRTTPDLPAQFFGSDRWYVWQSRELKPGDADKVPCLYDVIAMNYEAGSLTATEASAGGNDVQKVLNNLPFDRLVLTSRSPDQRGATMRELSRAGYSPIAPLRHADAVSFRLPAGSGRRVTYADGVLMTGGGDKGAALLALLDVLHLRGHYRSIVLVDDGQANIDSVQSALAKAGIDFHGRRYERVKPHPLPPVTEAQKDDARRAWRKWMELLDDVYPERAARLKANQCGGAQQ